MAENYLRQSPLAHLNPDSRAKFSDNEGNPGLIIEEQKDLTLLVIRGDPKNKKLVTKIKISYAKNKKFVVLCHAGIRSYNFGQWSLDNNLVNEIWNLEEGIDGWSKYIDQKVPRY